MIPLGAESKAHGPHLPLSSNAIQAAYYTRHVAENFDVVIAPFLNYGFYPPFIEYPGSTTLGLGTSIRTVTDICRGLARFGPRRFYVINQGVSTNAALGPAAAELRREGILLSYTNVATVYDTLKPLLRQQKGTHADEVETSIMLFVAPGRVDMKKAGRDYGEQRGSGVWPTRKERPASSLYTIYNPSGIYGDATLASKALGSRIVQAMISMIEKDLASLRSAPLPEVAPAAERLVKFPGHYAITANDIVTITRDGDTLVVERSGKPKMMMLAAGPNRSEHGRNEITFLADAAGVINELLVENDGIGVLARRLPESVRQAPAVP